MSMIRVFLAADVLRLADPLQDLRAPVPV